MDKKKCKTTSKLMIGPLYFFVLWTFLLSISFSSLADRTETSVNELVLDKVLEISIDSTINPATFHYVESASIKASEIGAKMILVKLNTPGGLLTTTKSIITAIGKSPIPYAVWITPEGASATSAGAIISAAAHFIFMSPGSNIGAATPVTITGGDNEDEDSHKKLTEQNDQKQKTNEKTSIESNQIKKMREIQNFKFGSNKEKMSHKAINDLTALVRSLGELRGRNTEPFEKMIREASSYSYKEAKEKEMIDGIVNNYDELFKLMNGKNIQIKGKSYIINSEARPLITFHEMDLGQKILDIFANPSLAYILFLLGAALIYFELQAPGGFIAGALGTMSLILAGIAFQVLPINFGSLGLIIFAFILFLLEVYIVSYGILTLLGLASLIFGSLFLFRSKAGNIDFHQGIIFSVVAAVAVFVIFIGFFLVNTLKKQAKKEKRIKDDHHHLVGKRGRIVSKLIETQENYPENNCYVYQVKISGEIWGAISDVLLEQNEEVVIKGLNIEKLKLLIKKV